MRLQKAHSQLSYCAAQVREHDPDRYLATLFAPADAREELFVLYAFDHEIGRVRRIVSEPMAGLVRLQWWRDALDAVAGSRPAAHPVVEALHARWTSFAPLQSRLQAAIDARDQELSAEPPADLAALEERLGSSWGEITLGALDLLGVAEKPARAAGRHLGLALGLVRLLQNLPGDLRQNRMPLPDAMLARHGLARESLQQEEQRRRSGRLSLTWRDGHASIWRRRAKTGTGCRSGHWRRSCRRRCWSRTCGASPAPASIRLRPCASLQSAWRRYGCSAAMPFDATESRRPPR